MKKIFNLTVMLAALMTAGMFSSCSKDEVDPLLAVTQTNDADGNYVFHVDARAGNVDLVSLTIMNGTNYAVDMSGKVWDALNNNNSAGGKINANAFQRDITFTKAAASKVFVFTLTDKDGVTVTKTLTAQECSDCGVGPVETPLSTKATFVLGRPGVPAAPASENGIEWTTNPNATTARFTAQNIVLTKAQYDAITTQEALAAAATGGFASTFEAQSDANFGGTKYFIIQDGSTLRLVEFTALNFVAGANRAHFTERN